MGRQDSRNHGRKLSAGQVLELFDSRNAENSTLHQLNHFIVQQIKVRSGAKLVNHMVDLFGEDIIVDAMIRAENGEVLPLGTDSEGNKWLIDRLGTIYQQEVDV